MTGVYYNTAAVIDADGTFLGKYRKNHIPQVAGFWEKYFFKPGNLGYPVFKTAYCKLGVYICYDRHFPEGWRALALNGAEYVVNPSATVAGLSQYLWELEQPASAVANGYYIGAINRVGSEAPWNIGQFYGSSYFVNPRGKIVAQAAKDKDELLVAISTWTWSAKCAICGSSSAIGVPRATAASLSSARHGSQRPRISCGRHRRRRPRGRQRAPHVDPGSMGPAAIAWRVARI